MKYIVYLHTTPNGKRYVGITCNRPKERWKRGRGYESQFFYEAVQEFGWDNIKHEVLFENLTEEEAEKKEVELISFYKSNQPEFGYNVYNGGNALQKLSDETKRKISEKLKGKVHSKESIERQRQKLLGRTWTPEMREHIMEARKNHPHRFTEEQRKAMSERVMGEKHPMYGKHHSEESRKKMSASQKGKKHGAMKESTKLLLSKTHAKDKKPIIQYDLHMNKIAEFDSVRSAERSLGVHSSAISKCAKGRQKTSCGYIWRYKGENNV